MLTNIPMHQFVEPDLFLKSNQELKEMDNLFNSIRSIGIVEPLIVQSYYNNKYKIINGVKRYHTALKLNHTVLPCIVRNFKVNELLNYKPTKELLREYILKERSEDKLWDNEIAINPNLIIEILELYFLDFRILSEVRLGNICLGNAVLLLTIPSWNQFSLIEEAKELSTKEFILRI